MTRTVSRRLVLLLCAAMAACSRTEPNADITDPPGGSATLQPIAQYDIRAHAAEPSGVVYDPRHNSLLVVSDSHPDIAELTLRGALIRKITTTSEDLEGIGLSTTGDTIYIAEERSRRIVLYTPSGARLSSFSADVATLANNGLEGVTLGPSGHLFVLNEKSPGMIMEMTPAGSEIRRLTLNLASDYSDLMYEASTNCLWIISDETRKIMRTDLNGALLQQWDVTFDKGEGIVIVRDTMYVVNDTDAHLYLFHKPQ